MSAQRGEKTGFARYRDSEARTRLGYSTVGDSIEQIIQLSIQRPMFILTQLYAHHAYIACQSLRAHGDIGDTCYSRRPRVPDGTPPMRMLLKEHQSRVRPPTLVPAQVPCMDFSSSFQREARDGIHGIQEPTIAVKCGPIPRPGKHEAECHALCKP